MLRREDPRITAGHFYQRQITQKKQENTMKINVEKTDSKGKFGEDNPIDLVLESTKMRIAMSYEDAYRMCVDVLAHLYQERQIENYRITTKGGSALNTAVTKDW